MTNYSLFLQYFSSARKITEEIYRKQRSGYQKRGKKVSKKSVKFPESLLKVAAVGKT